VSRICPEFVIFTGICALYIIRFEPAVRVATQYAPAPLLPLSRAAEQTQRSSTFPTPNMFPRWPLQPPYALRPRWVKRPTLTF